MTEAQMFKRMMMALCEYGALYMAINEGIVYLGFADGSKVDFTEPLATKGE